MSYQLSKPFYERILSFIEKEERVEVVYDDQDWNRCKAFDFILEANAEQSEIHLKSGLRIPFQKLVSVDIKRKKVDRCGIDAAANPCGDASEY